MASGLVAVPSEITEVIAGSLDLAGLRSLRMVCKDLNRKIFHYFSLSYFTTIRTDLSRGSLEKLQDISKEQPLRFYTQTLLVDKSPESVGNWYEDFENDFPWTRSSLGSLEAPLPGACILRNVLVGNLVNCRSFHIKGYEAEREPYQSDSITTNDIVGIILAIIADTSIPVRSFFIDYSGRGRVDAKQLQLPLHRQPGFTSGWAHLQELNLGISITPKDSEWVNNLILHAPRLRKLSLRFELGSSFPLVNLLASGHGLQGLHYFSLACLSITVDQLLRLLSSYRGSLRELLLHFIILDAGGTWVTVIEELRTRFPALDSISLNWLQERGLGQDFYIFFPRLANNPKTPDSERTAIGRAIVRSDSRVLQPSKLIVRLSYKRYCQDVRVVGVSYHGSKMGTFLGILPKSMERYRPRRV